MSITRFSISLVVYNSNQFMLAKTLTSLHDAVLKAKQSGYLDECYLTLVDNYPSGSQQGLEMLLKDTWAWDVKILSPMKNLGYGSGHNLAIESCCGDFHLVINPDVIVDIDAVIHSIDFLRKNPKVGLVTPFSQQKDGGKEYLCKRYPSILVLLMRAVGTKQTKKHFQKQLMEYEMRDKPETVASDILITSGCFMFFRKEALESVRGFNNKFFMYFEDFDLSLRLINHWLIAYVPKVKIVHFGGNTARKGGKHVLWFMRSAVVFFNQHGWRLW